MDILDFIARSEWPGVVGGALWLLRKPLRAMVNRVNPTKIDAWGFKAEFERTLDKVDLLTAPGTKETSKLAMDERLPRTELRQDTEAFQVPTGADSVSPDAVVLLAWRRLENVLRQLWTQKSGDHAINLRLFRTTSAGRELGLNDDEVQAIRELRSLRNKVAHAEDAPVTESEATRFSDATERLIERLSDEHKKGGSPDKSTRE